MVKLPARVERLMRRSDGGLIPTRFSIKVATNRKFSRKTARRLSPVIVPLSSAKINVPAPSGGSTGGAGGGGADHLRCPPTTATTTARPTPLTPRAISDLLSDALERSMRTDPCDADTDRDGAEDGFEYRSALDLNHYPRTPPYPYPGKRPYPNALDPSDGNTDYDGDSLTVREEFLAWFRFSDDGVRRPGRPTGNITSPGTFVLYSDGLQKSKDPAPAAPPGLLYNWVTDIDENNQLWDDERDADGDGLSNYDEQHGQFTEAWWPAQHDGTNEPKESKYPNIDFLDVEDLPQRDALADNDMDGDQIVDGNDDHDHDGVSNQFELRRPANWLAEVAGGNPWAYTNPFNPCKPFNSERCHSHPPFGYYASDGAPPIGPAVPAGFPGGGPPTPEG